jgi:DNA ligase D-like protein (predicted polymerase)
MNGAGTPTGDSVRRVATPATEVDVDGIAVRVSNPDKVYFPDGTTKGDVVKHVLTCAPGFVKALRDRPTYLERYPDGIEGEQIYQKRVPEKRPEWIETVRVTFPSGRHADALCVTEAAHVVWAANLGALRFHPWPTRRTNLDHADELRIDLDPQPGTGFEEARATAAIVKELLDELGLVGWPKTSGGRGIHVYVRIQPRWGFVEVRRAALALAREAERREPDLVTSRWWKEERGVRVLLDYNQNARDRTVAAAYSVRPAPGGNVSSPFTWDELPTIDPDAFNVRNSGDWYAARADVHAGIDGTAYDLTTLLEWADRDEAAGLGDAPYPPNYPKMPGEPKRVQPSKDRDLKAAREAAASDGRPDA